MGANTSSGTTTLKAKVTMPFADLSGSSPNVKEKLTSRDGRQLGNVVELVTKETDTKNVHHFVSSRELAEYDVYVNSRNKTTDTDFEFETEYNKRIALRDLGSHMTERMNIVYKSDNDINNIQPFVLAHPMQGKIKNFAGAPGLTDLFNQLYDLKGVNNKLNGAKSVKDLANSGASVPKWQLDTAYQDLYKSAQIAMQEMGFTEEDFKVYADQIMKGDVLYNSDTSITSPENAMKGILGSINEYGKDLVSRSPGLKLGEAKVLNPDFQFNELDDVRSNFRLAKIGRLYGERIYNTNLPVVNFQPGEIKINTLGLGFANAIANTEAKSYQNYIKGDSNALAFAASKFGGAIAGALSAGGKFVLDKAKFYQWLPSVGKYLKIINTVLVELGIWMGVIDTTASNETFQKELNAWNELNKSVSEDAYKKLFDKDGRMVTDYGTDKGEEEAQNIRVEAFKGYMGGGDYFSAIRCLPQFMNIHGTTVEAIQSAWSASDDAAGSALLTGELLIPFGMSKGASISETFSNSTQAHPLVSQYNDKYSETNEAKMVGTDGVMGSAFDLDPNAVVGQAVEGAKNVAKTMVADLASDVGIGGTRGMVVSGAGRFVLPEVWADSSFDRSYSINLRLRTPYGHRLSIFENTMIPMMFLVTLASSRQVGVSMYTNPFYVKVYAKGLISCDLGMITNLSVSRGDDKNNRTPDGFFRTANISINIKDMVPNLSMAMDNGVFPLNKSTNEGMMNYICSLAGVDFVERGNLAKNIEKFATSITRSFNDSIPNSAIWLASESHAGRLTGRFLQSTGKIENPYKQQYSSQYSSMT